MRRVLILLLATPSLALAQQADTARPSILRLVAGGLAGLGATAALASHVSRDCGDVCFVGPATVIVFAPVLVPTGIYAANKGQASFGTIFWHSVGGLIAGGLVAAALYEADHDSGVVGVPLVFASQLAFGIMGARARTTRP